MRHHDSVFHGLTKWIDWGRFESLVATHRGDRGVRRLSCRDQLLAMLFAQLSGAQSLRAVEAGLQSQRSRLYGAGVRPVARATLADANGLRPAAMSGDLFATMAGAAGRGLRRKLGEVRILDATRIALASGALPWARGPRDIAAAKLHPVWDPDAAVPCEARITGPGVNDITPAKAAEIVPGATYVFDLGYYSFDWWAALDSRGCRFVTRLKKTTELTRTRALPCSDDPAIRSDITGLLPLPHGRPLQRSLREITVVIEGGKRLRLVTNDLVSPAREIAALYRTRWQIELAFKWIKQNLGIRRFLGTSENAVRIQIYTALIAWLILRMARAAQSAVQGATTFARLVRLNLMDRRPLDRLTDPPIPIPADPRQLEMALP